MHSFHTLHRFHQVSVSGSPFVFNPPMGDPNFIVMTSQISNPGGLADSVLITVPTPGGFTASSTASGNFNLFVVRQT